MKIDRHLGIISLLLRQDKVTAPYLAEKFEVSRRTINRDIEDICKAGFPIVTIQGVNGGISIADGFKFDKSILKREELESILIGLKSLESVSGITGTEQLYHKLSAHKNSMDSPKENMIIDLASHYKSSLSEKITGLKKAMEERKSVSFQYFSSRGESRRFIEPYYITFKWSDWYVFGYCTDRKDFRLFKLNRMNGLTISDQSFLPRELPDERAELNDYFTVNYPVKAVFHPSVKYRLVEEYGAESFRVLEDGRLLFDNYFTDKEYMFSWLFGFTDKVEVVEPEELRKEMKHYAENILKKYQKT